MLRLFRFAILCLIASVASVQAQTTKTSEQEFADAKQLVEELLPAAAELLEQYGSFIPFAGGLTLAGDVDIVSLEDQSSPDEIVAERIELDLKRGAAEGRYKATALMADVQVQKDSTSAFQNTVYVQFEHRNGYCVDMFWPYSTSNEGRIVLGDSWNQNRTGSVFGSCRQNQTAGDIQDLLLELQDLQKSIGQ